MEIIEKARECYDSLSSFRRKRNRCRDYTFGRQWNDLIEVDGRQITEYEYILSEGNVPLKNNLIRRIVRNVLGVFRKGLPDIMRKYYSGNLEKIAEENSLEEIFCRSLEEFMISGMVVHKKHLGPVGDNSGVLTNIVSPGAFFFDSDSRDIRGRDLSMVGEMHKVRFEDWCKTFVTDSAGFEEAKKLFDATDTLNVTEVWKKEMVPGYLVHDTDRGLLMRIREGEKGRQAKGKQ